MTKNEHRTVCEHCNITYTELTRRELWKFRTGIKKYENLDVKQRIANRYMENTEIT